MKIQNYLIGILLIFVGFLIIAHNMYWFDIGEFISDYWPLLIVAIGIYFVVTNFLRSRDKKSTGFEINIGDKSFSTTEKNVYESNVFGDIKLNIKSVDFIDGSVKNVFGDIDMDITQINLKEGEKTLYVSTVFGDIDVFISKKIPFAIKASNTFGDLKILGTKKEGIGKRIVYKSEGYEKADKKIALTISQVFGDLHVF